MSVVRVVVIVHAAVLASATLATCGPDRAAYTAEQLDEALVTAQELADTTGLEWTETQRTAFDTRAPENPSIDASLWCPTGRAAGLDRLAGDSGVDVELVVKDTDSPYMVREQVWTNADVRRYYASLSAVVTGCSGVTWNDGDGNSYLLEPNPMTPRIGDESVSWTVTITLGASSESGVTTLTQQTVARFGEALMVIQGGAIRSSDTGGSAPNYTLLVRAAANKMTRLRSE